MSTAAEVPSISTASAHLFCLGFALSYVGSIYISKNARLSYSATAPKRDGELRPRERDERWRDDPDVIKARLAAVSLASLTCCLAVLVTVWVTVGGGKTVSPCLVYLNEHSSALLAYQDIWRDVVGIAEAPRRELTV